MSTENSNLQSGQLDDINANYSPILDEKYSFIPFGSSNEIKISENPTRITKIIKVEDRNSISQQTLPIVQKPSPIPQLSPQNSFAPQLSPQNTFTPQLSPQNTFTPQLSSVPQNSIRFNELVGNLKKMIQHNPQQQDNSQKNQGFSFFFLFFLNFIKKKSILREKKR
jgi:hypothetical protein